MNKTVKLIWPILAVDAVVVLLHIVTGTDNFFFNLDKENSLPAYYSGLKLLFLGSVFVYAALKKKVWLWLPAGLFFLWLAFDEVFELHEQILFKLVPESITRLGWFSNPVFYWVVLFSPLIIAALIYLFYLARSVAHKKYFYIGAIFFALVVLSEFVGGFITSTQAGYILMGFEESFEIFGTTAFLAGAINLAKNNV